MTATLSTPRARAHALARDLARLGEPGEVQAEVHDWRPSPPCLTCCRHDGCDQPATVRLTATAPLSGEQIDEDWCSRHALGFVRLLLEDPHRYDEPDRDDIRCEVAP